jgi:hypothetical protein
VVIDAGSLMGALQTIPLKPTEKKDTLERISVDE